MCEARLAPTLLVLGPCYRRVPWPSRATLPSANEWIEHTWQRLGNLWTTVCVSSVMLCVAAQRPLLGRLAVPVQWSLATLRCVVHLPTSLVKVGLEFVTCLVSVTEVLPLSRMTTLRSRLLIPIWSLSPRKSASLAALVLLAC